LADHDKIFRGGTHHEWGFVGGPMAHPNKSKMAAAAISKMAAAAIFNFGKNFNNSGLDKKYLHQISWEDASRPCGDDHVTKSWNRKLIRVTSSNEGLKHMCRRTYSTEHKYHTTNTPEWPNSHKLKIQDGGGRHLEFRKDVNNFGLDKDILHQIIWEYAPRRRGGEHVPKSRNRKLIRVTSSNKCQKHMCVDLSDYNRYLNQIWYRTQIPHCQHAWVTKLT